MMARDTNLYSLAHAAAMIHESIELVEVVAANTDNIEYGGMIIVLTGSEDGVTAFTARGIESLKEFLDDVRSWEGGLRQFLLDEQCDTELIERIMAHETSR